MQTRKQLVLNIISKYRDSDFDQYINTNFAVMGLTDVLPIEITRGTNLDEVSSFVTTMFDNIDKNDRLHEVDTIIRQKFDTLSEAELIEAISWGICLDRMTASFYHDPQLFDRVERALTARRQFLSNKFKLRVLLRIKLWSVFQATRKLIIEPAAKGKSLSLTKLRFFLFINIAEIAFYEFMTGHLKNSWRGFRLAFKFPTKFMRSSDSKGLGVYFTDTVAWDKEYELWNMMFVSEWSTYYFGIMKLIIPHVSGFSDRPELFLHNRVIALYLYLNRSMLGQFLDVDKLDS